MTRYRLRTLLIVLSLLCVVIARIAYLKHKADFHQKDFNRLVPRIAEAERQSTWFIEHAVRRLAHFGPYAARELVISENGASESVGRDEWERNVADWEKAKRHRILADRYGRATLRPWTFVSDDRCHR
jgi:hypothetical protein